MLENLNIRPASVIGPLGEELTLDNLPPPETTRWVSRRKAQVVAAVEGGLLTPVESCARYRMDLEELASWQRLFDQVGAPGLRTTRIQYDREGVRARPCDENVAPLLAWAGQWPPLGISISAGIGKTTPFFL